VLFWVYAGGTVKLEKKKHTLWFLQVDCSVLLQVYAVGTSKSDKKYFCR
jgi:hypothetical protein